VHPLPYPTVREGGTTAFLTIPKRDYSYLSHSWVLPTMLVATSWWDEKRKRLITPKHPPEGRRVADSGGFLAHQRFGGFPYSIDQLADWALAWGAEWVACPDWPCEPEIARGEVDYRIQRTVDSAIEAMQRRPDVNWHPVLQGWKVEDYLRCWCLYETMGITPRAIGTLCRRGKSRQIAAILGDILAAHPGHRYHLFGVKLDALKHPETVAAAESIDTAAWSMLDHRLKTAWGVCEYRISSSLAHKVGMTRCELSTFLAERYYKRIQALLRCSRQQVLWDSNQ